MRNVNFEVFHSLMSDRGSVMKKEKRNLKILKEIIIKKLKNSTCFLCGKLFIKHEVWKMVDNLQVTLCLDLNIKGHVNILYSSRNSHQRCAVKKVFLKISQILQESTWWYQKHHIIIDFLLAWKATWKHKNSIY